MTDPVPSTTTQAGGSPRWMRLALVVSLAVNLGVAGLVGGTFFSHRGGPPEGRDGSDISIWALPQALSREDRRILRETMLAGRKDRRAAAIADLGALSAALRADPYDAAAVQAVFDRQIARMSDGLRSAQTAMAGRFNAMTPAERAAIADRLDAAAANPRGLRGKDRGDHPKL